MASIAEIMERLFRKGGRASNADGGRGGAPLGRLTVLVARLQGDSGGALTRHLAEAIDRTAPNVKVRVLTEPIGLRHEGQPAPKLAVAEGSVRAMALEAEAEVVVWGAVDPSLPGATYRVGFLSAAAPAMGRTRPYALGASLALPARLEGIHVDILRAAIAAAVQPVTEKVNRDRLELGRASVDALGDFLVSPPDDAGPVLLASVQDAYANLALLLGEWGGQIFWFDRALEFYRKRLETLPRETDPLGHALALVGQGATLQLMGERTKGSSFLGEAGDPVRRALEILTKETYPFRWALVNANLGDLLALLGHRDEDVPTLEAAVAAHQAALTVITRELAPLRWASLQHNLGTALNTLSRCELGTTRLAEIVIAYREALKVRTRAAAPLLWAETQAALATALFRFGKMLEKRELLEAARQGFEHAVDVFEEQPGQERMAQAVKREVLRVERVLETRDAASEKAALVKKAG